MIKPQIIVPADGAGRVSSAKSSQIIKVYSQDPASIEFTAKDKVGYKLSSMSDQATNPSLAQINTLFSDPNWNSNNPDINKTQGANQEPYLYVNPLGFITFSYSGVASGYEFVVLFDSGSAAAGDYEFVISGDVNENGTTIVSGTATRSDALKDEVVLTATGSSGTVTLTNPRNNAQFMFKFVGESDRLFLDLENSNGLDAFTVNDNIRQDDDAAQAKLSSYNIALSRMSLNESTGTWSPNTGNYVVGPEVTDPNAPDPSGVNFVGSNFVSSDDSLDPGSADWQVTTLADTGYSSIVSSVDKHPEMTPPEWTSGALEGETEYRARTKYYAASGEASEWSDDVTFKTAAKGLQIVNKPGNVYAIWRTDKRLQAPTSQPPSKLVNIVQRSARNIVAIGVDGKIYATSEQSNFPNITWTTWSEYTGNSAVAFTCAWNEPTWLIAQSDGTIIKSPSIIADPPDDAINNAKNLIALGSVPQYVGFTTPEGINYIYNFQDGAYFGDVALTKDTWTKVEVNLPNGERVVKISGIANAENLNYQSRNLAILSDAGNLYTVITRNLGWSGGPPKTGTVANPNLWLTDVFDVNPIDRSDIIGGLSVLKNDGTLWGAFWSDRPTTPSPFPSVTNWQQIGTDTDWLTAAYALPHELSHWIALKSDGYIYIGGPKSLDYAKLDYNGNPESQISTFGSLPYCQQGNENAIWVILPDA